MQRLLNHAVWDTTAAMDVIRRFVAEHLAPVAGGLAVAALDETGQEKKDRLCRARHSRPYAESRIMPRRLDLRWSATVSGSDRSA